MPRDKVHYSYVDIHNTWMRVAYNFAKGLYEINKWNLKTTPVAILVSKDGSFISMGVCADGAHPIQAKCGRLASSGQPYTNCEFCAEEQHAERKALRKAYDKDLTRAKIYVYGHYKLCDSCVKALCDRGIDTFYLLENADVLFNRHHPDTVLGTNKQFEV